MKNKIIDKLRGDDLRSIGRSNELVKEITNQHEFDELFYYLMDTERTIVMRAADAIEKITIQHSEYLSPHKTSLLNILNNAKNKELKWHIALLISRVTLSKREIWKIWDLLINWTLNKKESRIVRVNSLQGLHNLLSQYPQLKADFEQTLQKLEKENIPSLNARIKKLKKKE